MEEQNGLAKQNKIFSMFENNEKKMRKILLIIVICVITFSSVMSLAFSYKSYNEVKNIMNKEEIDKTESFAYETLIVSYSNGSLLSCNDNGCGNTVVSIVNDGKDTVYYNISFVDVGGDGNNYKYLIIEPNNSLEETVPSSNLVVREKIEINPGESQDYNVALSSVDGLTHSNYQMRIQVNMDTDKELFLE